MGDAGAVPSGTGRPEPCPQLAQVAIQSGRHAGRQILPAAARAGPPTPFRYHDKGLMATIGRRAAVAQLRRRPHPAGHARLAGLARPAPRLPGRLPQPGGGARQLVVALPGLAVGAPAHRGRRRVGCRRRVDSETGLAGTESVCDARLRRWRAGRREPHGASVELRGRRGRRGRPRAWSASTARSSSSSPWWARAWPAPRTRLLDGDREAARVLAESDETIDALYREVEQLAQSQLAQRATGPDELRYLVAVLRMLPELERSGDLAEHVSRRAVRGLGVELSPRARGLVEQMGEVACEMWRATADAYADRAPVADEVEELDDELDELHVTLTAEIASGSMPLPVAIEAALVARFYERFGDHAVNLARRIAVLVGRATTGRPSASPSARPPSGARSGARGGPGGPRRSARR